MKYLILIFFLTFWINCNSQTDNNLKVRKSKSESISSSQERGEDFKIKRFFENKYERSEYPRFDGEITINDSEIQFGEIQYIKYSNIKPEYKLIFEKGLLYPNAVLESVLILQEVTGETTPGVWRLDSMDICCLEELTFLSDNPQIKRFRFWRSTGSMNPSVYFFELINETANKETDRITFIENAKLTFIKYA